MSVDVAWTARPMVGETECGDAVFVARDPSAVLVAVVDGLGHGPKAAQAAQAAVAFVDANRDLALTDLFRRCDRVIASTRGVAMSIIRIRLDDLRMQHAGVGNVDVTSHSRERVRPVSRPGVVGGRFRRVVMTQFQLHPGDRLVMYTDGISSRMRVEDYGRLGGEAAAAQILQDWGKEHDDASCAVIACRAGL